LKHIFLISQPRAGSTFLQRILSNHSNVHTLGEPWFLLPIFKNDFELKVLKDAKYNSTWTNSAISEFFKSTEDFDDLFKENQITLYKNICKSLANSKGCDFFLDKTPRYYFIIKEISLTFPKSKVLVLLRNPIDVFNSVLDSFIKKDYSLLGLYEDDIFESPLLLLKQIKTNKNKNILFIKYEDILNDTKQEIKKICLHIGLDFEDSMLNISNSREWKFGDPKMNIKKEIDVTNINVWSKYLTTQKWRFFRDYVNTLGSVLINEFGYSYEELDKILVENKPSKFKLIFTVSLNFYFSKFYTIYLKPFYILKRKIKYRWNLIKK
jgi:hypothetical protein